MQRVTYYCTLPFLYLISLFPSWLCRLLADLLFIILYYIVRYRRTVVHHNLANAFPEKSERERMQVEKRFYHFLCDLMVETIQMISMSRSYMARHCTFSNQAAALFDDYAGRKQSIIVVMGHFGNWEWAGLAFPIQRMQRLQALYRTLSNAFWNRFIIRMRSRFGTRQIEVNDTFREMLRHRDETTATVFIADQTPFPEHAFWTTFLNQDTPVFLGTEVLAKKLNLPVVYASVNRLKRGYYEIRAERLFETPAQTAAGEITQAHTLRLERDIQRMPETWLWSHRRWKHRRK